MCFLGQKLYIVLVSGRKTPRTQVTPQNLTKLPFEFSDDVSIQVGLWEGLLSHYLSVCDHNPPTLHGRTERRHTIAISRYSRTWRASRGKN